MQLRYSYPLYPTPCQRAALARAFGCARVVFNDALAARTAAFKAGEPYILDAALSKRLRESLNARGGQVRPAATLAQACEAGSRRGAA
jgi:N-dimethylarginine dimethylaminohydrolase